MKLIAFYLPQFHEIPENNMWWGKGFTEWVNVKKNKKIFPKHYQPRVPYKNNYYDLSNVLVMKWQAKLAKKYGISGFCFYHYWFAGKKLLEKPVEQLLNTKSINIEYCFAWANEPWTRTWHGAGSSSGKHKEVLIRQSYGEYSDWVEHFNYLLPFFLDKRYIKKDNKPILLIYRVGYMVKGHQMFECWNNEAKKNGFDGIHILSMLSAVDKYDYNKYIEGTVDFEPGKTRRINNMFKSSFNKVKDFIIDHRLTFSLYNKYLCNIMSYDKVNKEMINKKHIKNEYRGIFVDYDDSPRRQMKGTIVLGSTPRKFEKYLYINMKKSQKEGNDIVFINAWNEWGESNYLEPDERYGFSYLYAIKNAVKKFKKERYYAK